jgi:hypothetical protein
LLFYVLANTKSAKVQNRIKSALFKFPQIRAHLPRTELQALGVKPGPEFDHLLAKIFDLQLDGKIKSHPQLMKEMRELAGIKEPPPPPPPPPTPPPKKGKEKHPEHGAAHKKGRESATAPSPAPSHKGKESAAGAALHAEHGKPAVHAGAKSSTVKLATKPAPKAKPTVAAKAAPKPGKKAKKR